MTPGRPRPPALPRWLSLAAALALATLPGTAGAQSTPAPTPPPAATPAPATIQVGAPIAMDTDTARLLQLPDPVKTEIVANPDIADIQPAGPTSVLLVGKHPGVTNVFVVTQAGVTTSWAVRVTRPASELLSALQRAVPAAHVTVATAPEGLTVSGSVGSPRDAEQLRAIAQQFLGEKDKLNFQVTVDAVTQVTLRVRVAEISRSISRSFGVNLGADIKQGSITVALLTGSVSSSAFGEVAGAFSGNGGRLNIAGIIDALDQEGLATILAEPNLTATSGETATFLAGGEIPVPSPQGNNTVTFSYQPYGVSVGFTPFVLDGDRISMRVRPEVSQLTTVGGLELDGVAIPALTVRRVETTVELGSGESFAIAGLFQNNGANQMQAFPWLANIPILGPLFRSNSFQRNESELVIIVTPFLVRPVTHAADLHLPTEGFKFASDIEQILRGRLAGRPPSPPQATAGPTPHLSGQAGFILE